MVVYTFNLYILFVGNGYRIAQDTLKMIKAWLAHFNHFFSYFIRFKLSEQCLVIETKARKKYKPYKTTKQ